MELFEWQKEAIKKSKNSNTIISTPVNSGKSIVAKKWLQSHEFDKKIITVPIKALANELYINMSNEYGEDKIGIETGDIKKNIKDCEYLICIQEIFTRKYASWTKSNIGCVIDEFHYMFNDHQRTRPYIDSIKKSKSNIKFMIMSGTLPKVNKLISYVENISNKSFTLISNNYRPTKLIYHKEPIDITNIIMPNTLIYIFSIKLIDSVVNTLLTYLPRLPLMKRRKIQKIARHYHIQKISKELAYGICVYHGQLSHTEKIFRHHLIKEGFINYIISTNALGVGVNLPIQNVIFTMTQIPNEIGNFRDINKIEFEQLSGRAGRYGIFDEGHIYLCKHNLFKQPHEDRYKRYLELLEEDYSNIPLKLYLSPDIDQMIKNDIHPNDEIEYIKKYSIYENEDEFNVYLDAIKHKLTNIYDQLQKIDNEFKSLLRTYYYPSMSFDDNISVLTMISKTKFQNFSYKHILNAINDKSKYVDKLLLTRGYINNIGSVHKTDPNQVVYDYNELIEEIKIYDPLIMIN